MSALSEQTKSWEDFEKELAALRAEGRLDEAIERLDGALLKRADKAGWQLLQATLCFERLEQRYAHERVWKNLARDEHLYEKVVLHAERALECDEDLPEAHNLLATLAALREDWERADLHWESSLSLYPDQPAVRKKMVAVRHRLHRD